jgi:hypothetical protein
LNVRADHPDSARAIAASFNTPTKSSGMGEAVDGNAVARPVVAQGVRIWRAALAALSANLVGIGLARFAYTPLITALAEAGWFTAKAATYLGAANLAGTFTPLFITGAGLMLVALAVDIAAGSGERRHEDSLRKARRAGWIDQLIISTSHSKC